MGEKRARRLDSQPPISQFFRPSKQESLIRESIVIGFDEEERLEERDKMDIFLDLTDRADVDVDIVNEDEETIVIIEEPRKKKHSFFTRFDEKIKVVEERKSHVASFAKYPSQAPLFPTFAPYRKKCENSCMNFVFKKRRKNFINDNEFSTPFYNAEGCEWSERNENDFSQIDKIYKSILDSINESSLRKEVESDEDDWLPDGFRDLRLKVKSSKRHVHLICGPTGVGKSHLAKRLSEALQSDFYEINTIGSGSNGERISKVFNDLIVSTSHQMISGFSTSKSDSKYTVILIDEIDLVFEGDSSFFNGLTNYLINAPPKHVIVMTSNAPYRVLSCFYTFSTDLQIHAIDEEYHDDLMDDLFVHHPVEWEDSSILTCIDEPLEHQIYSLYTNDAYKSFICYAQRGINLREPPSPSMEDWSLYSLPAWHSIEKGHAATEEERQMQRRKRSKFRSYPYLRGGIPPDITSIVLNYTL